jgi:hypothetical protein
MAKISVYPNGNPPVDSDEFIVARAGDNRKLTWANIKATLKTYFDTLYTLAAHGAASAAVHGLPANVNVLGNRNAAGEFIQRGTTSGTASVLAGSISYAVLTAKSFPVAFSSSPLVIGGGTTSAVDCIADIFDITTTTFTHARWTTGVDTAANVGWLAIGT